VTAPRVRIDPSVTLRLIAEQRSVRIIHFELGG